MSEYTEYCFNDNDYDSLTELKTRNKKILRGLVREFIASGSNPDILKTVRVDKGKACLFNFFFSEDELKEEITKERKRIKKKRYFAKKNNLPYTTKHTISVPLKTTSQGHTYYELPELPEDCFYPDERPAPWKPETEKRFYDKLNETN
jgi:hypothetical protein